MNRGNREYSPLRDRPEEAITASRKNFFVFLAGKTNNAHRDFVKKIQEAGHREVDSHQECDYCLVFCPVASRVGTDVSEALDRAPAGKPIILVVMHHTFNPDHVVAESRRLVENTNVHLTVDCLFYESRLLNCPTNEIAWFDIQKRLGLIQGSLGSQVIDYIRNNPWMTASFFVGVAGLITLITVLVKLYGVK